MNKKFKKLFLIFIIWLYKKYVNCIFIPSNTELCLKKSLIATIQPKLSLWIIHRNHKPYHIHNGKIEYGTDEFFYDWNLEEIIK
jgi:hypothetical protein